MSIIAIDLWDKRCGIATQSMWIAFAGEIVARHEIVSVLKKYFSKQDYTTIVVWLPYDLYGKKEQQLNKTKKFIEKLQEIFPDKQVVWVDERFTSFSADMTLKQMWNHQNIWQKDALAAAEILQNYIDQKK